MHRQACSRLLYSLPRDRLTLRSAPIVCRSFSAQGGEPKATPALLDKIKDKELLKVLGFIGGQWVAASDGSTMEVHAHQLALHDSTSSVFSLQAALQVKGKSAVLLSRCNKSCFQAQPDTRRHQYHVVEHIDSAAFVLYNRSRTLPQAK